MKGTLELGAQEASTYGKRSAANARTVRPHCIDGKYYSTQELAAELGVTRRKASDMLANAQAQSGAVTMERLRASSSTRPKAVSA